MPTVDITPVFPIAQDCIGHIQQRFFSVRFHQLTEGVIPGLAGFLPLEVRSLDVQKICQGFGADTTSRATHAQAHDQRVGHHRHMLLAHIQPLDKRQAQGMGCVARLDQRLVGLFDLGHALGLLDIFTAHGVFVQAI